MSDIQAKNAFLWVNDGSGFRLAGCMKALSLQFTVDDIETTTANSSSDREYVAGFSKTSGTFDAITSIDQLTKYQYADFVVNRRDVLAYRVGLTDNSGNILQFDFNAKVQTVTLNNQIPQVSGYSVAFLVSGVVTLTITIDGVSTSYLLDGNNDYIFDGSGEYIIV